MVTHALSPKINMENANSIV